jgi:L-threonylcarbamoyladenylate synthase
VAHIISIEYSEAPKMSSQVLHAGGLIVLPTDTVYGVGSLLDEAAINRIYAAKQRPPEKAIPVLISDIDAALCVATHIPDQARQLAEVFWPGPLTLALPKRDDLPSNLSALPTVGVRIPDHAGTRAVIAGAGGALAVTSANRSEEPPACTIHEAIQYLDESVALYLDGGPCQGGVPSTVVTFDNGDLRVLRVGPITEAMLRQVFA